MTAPHHCGMVAIVGRPNVGKSSLLNALIGANISITSKKAQTTRHQILGVRTTDRHQILFVDTPGIQHSHQAALNRQLNKAAVSAFGDVDAVLWVIESDRLTPEDERVLQMLPTDLPVVVALNKVDLFKADADKAKAFELAKRLHDRRPFAALVPVSAKRRFQLDALADALAEQLPEQDPLVDEETVTDKSVRFLSAELIREKLFRLMGDELPYACTVVIDRFAEPDATEAKPAVEIDATIVVAKASQKPMVIGEGGERIKRIGSQARQDIMQLLEQPVRLRLWVKVKANWSDDEAAVRSFGYE